jgi:Anti-sigma factor NepR
MARGKASVQLYDHTGEDLARSLDGRPALTLVAGAKPAGTPCGAVITSSLDEHIADQLRLAYDALLHAPIPDHLNKLLTDLCEAEGKS